MHAQNEKSKCIYLEGNYCLLGEVVPIYSSHYHLQIFPRKSNIDLLCQSARQLCSFRLFNDNTVSAPIIYSSETISLRLCNCWVEQYMSLFDWISCLFMSSLTRYITKIWLIIIRTIMQKDALASLFFIAISFICESRIFCAHSRFLYANNFTRVYLNWCVLFNSEVFFLANVVACFNLLNKVKANKKCVSQPILSIKRGAC